MVEFVESKITAKMSLGFVWLNLALVLCCTVGLSQAGFSWKQCDDGNTFLIEHLEVQPYPMKFPGDMFFSLNMTLLRELNGSDISIAIYWKTFMGNFKIPCLFQLGSCRYSDACTLMDRMIDENWAGFMTSFVSQVKDILVNNGVDMSCPVMPQDIRLFNQTMRMPNVPSFLTYFAGGDYLVKVSTIDKQGREKETFCLDLSTA